MYDWNNLRLQLKQSFGLSYGYGHSFIPGCSTAEIGHRDFVGPLAILWFNVNGDRLSILNIFVDDRLRRCGLATSLLRLLAQGYPTKIIRSDDGTKLGKAWMTHVGFVETPSGWDYTKHLSTGKKPCKKGKKK